MTRTRALGHIGQPTHHGRRVEPFRIAGISIDTFWGEHKHDERLPALEAAIDATCRPRTVAQTLTVIEGHDERILQHIAGGGRRQPAAPSSRGEPAPIGDQAAPLDVDDVVVDVVDRAVEPAPAPPLLGGVTIKRRRRGARSPDDVAASDAPTQPATLPPAPTPPVAPAQPVAERELVEPAAIAPDRARSDQAAGADVDARRLASMRRTLAGPGSSPLLDSLEEDLKRLRARERRDD